MDSFEKDNQKQPKNEGEEPYSFIEEHIRKRPMDRRKFLWGALRLFLSAIVFGAVAGFVFVLVTGGDGLSRMNANAALLTEAPETSALPRKATATPAVTDSVASSEDSLKNPASSPDASASVSSQDVPSKKDPKTPTAAAELSKDSDSSGDSEVSRNSGNSGVSVDSRNSGKASGTEAEGKKHARSTPTPTPTVEELEAEAVRTYERFQEALGKVFEQSRSHLAFVTSIGGQEEGIFGTGGKMSKAIGLIIGKDSRRLFILLGHLPGGEKHQVSFADSTTSPAKVFASDPSTGLTIMAAALRDLNAGTLEVCTPAKLGNSYSLHGGELVLAIGTMLSEMGDYMRGTILSADYPYNVPDREYRLLATDMPCAAGAEGYLVDTKGSVVGIFSDKFTPAGTSLIAALPISMVKTLLTNMMNREKLVSLGVMGRDISPEEAESLGVPAGIYVLYAEEESAALEAGIRTGDVITGINGKEITTLLLLEEELYRHEPGDSLTVTLMRLCPDGYEEVTCEAILNPLETKSATR